jgi:hypothetical protein
MPNRRRWWSRPALTVVLALASGAGSPAQSPLLVGEYAYLSPALLTMGRHGERARTLFHLPPTLWLPLDATVDPATRSLWWLDGSGQTRILRAGLDGSGLQTVLLLNAPGRGPALDGQGRIYYVEGNTLCRALANGTATQVLFTAQQTWPIGCPIVDADNGHVYVGADGAILRFDLAGTNPKTVVTGLGFARALALDVGRNHIWLIDAQPATDHVGRARLDGTEVTVVVDNSPTTVMTSGLVQFTYDPHGDELWFGDDLQHTISRARGDGSGVAVIHRMQPPRAPGSVALLSGAPRQPLADCNGNGRADAQDLQNGSSADCNGNGVPDECEARPCPQRRLFLDHGSNPLVPGRALGCAIQSPNGCFEVFQPFDVPSPGAALAELALDGWTANYAGGDGFTAAVLRDDGSGQAADESTVLASTTLNLRFDPDRTNWVWAPLSVALPPGRHWLRLSGNEANYQAGVNVGNLGGLGSRTRNGNGVWFSGQPLALRLAAATLATSAPEVSRSAAGAVDFVLDAGAGHAGEVYWLLGSLGGAGPGLPLGPGLVLPLQVDPYTLFTIQSPNTAPLLGSLGTLDAQGMATAHFQMPANVPVSLVGIVLQHAFFTLTPASVPTFVSAAVPLQIVP